MLLIMLRMGRCFRRQRMDLEGFSLTPALKELVARAEWFWPRQAESSGRFLMVAQRLVDALDQEAAMQPALRLKLHAAAQEWRMIMVNHQKLLALQC